MAQPAPGLLPFSLSSMRATPVRVSFLLLFFSVRYRHCCASQARQRPPFFPLFPHAHAHPFPLIPSCPFLPSSPLFCAQLRRNSRRSPQSSYVDLPPQTSSAPINGSPVHPLLPHLTPKFSLLSHFLLAAIVVLLSPAERDSAANFAAIKGAPTTPSSPPASSRHVLPRPPLLITGATSPPSTASHRHHPRRRSSIHT